MRRNGTERVDQPPVMNDGELIDYLRAAGLITGRSARLLPIAGGISSDISLVESDKERFVIKRSLPQLKTEDAWFCDTKRNVTEFEAIRYAGRLFPESVPELLLTDAESRLFAMQFFGPEFTPWKTSLLGGDVDLKIGKRVAGLLAALHRGSWCDPAAIERFDTGPDFFALRVEPYLLTTGRRHPDIEWLFQAEADRIKQTSLALVHGDWSAKNLLVSGERVIVLDWEASWFGDPAFDAAFMLNLIYLKSLYNRQKLSEYLELMRVFRGEYGRQVYPLDSDLERRIPRLTLMLMLGRIDGKSRAEYITTSEDKELVRTFVRRALIAGVDNWAEVDNRWESAVRQK
jgi:aminoglycoside phosphotransferase (APT) family kinase protein